MIRIFWFRGTCMMCVCVFVQVCMFAHSICLLSLLLHKLQNPPKLYQRCERPHLGMQVAPRTLCKGLWIRGFSFWASEAFGVLRGATKSAALFVSILQGAPAIFEWHPFLCSTPCAQSTPKPCFNVPRSNIVLEGRSFRSPDVVILKHTPQTANKHQQHGQIRDCCTLLLRCITNSAV